MKKMIVIVSTLDTKGQKVTRMGGIIMPPMPAFYHHPKTIEDLIDQTIGKVLDLFSVDARLFKRWGSESK